MARVLCGISGGVDSAVAALLLKKWGFNVVGVFMKNWDLRDETGYCSSEEDVRYAEKVCKSLEIPYREVDFVKDYWNNVFTETLHEYECGRTPNPDVLCNKYIKFHSFLHYAKNAHNAHNIATGHYARTSENFRQISIMSWPNRALSEVNGRNNGKLYKAVDQGKDQTFFLNRISGHSVQHTIFPLGNLLKRSVKEIAFLNGLEFVSKRKESMGICFIGLRDFPQFIVDYIPPKTGNYICLETGDLLGQHDGYFKVTVGQRAPISIKSTAYYVVDKNAKSGDIYLAPGTLHHALFSSSIVTDAPHWIDEAPGAFSKTGVLKCALRVMHREPIVNCEIHRLDDGKCLMIMDEPLRAITPGQSAVMYLDSECLGGTKISHVGPSLYESYFGFPNLADHRLDALLWDDLFREFGGKILPSSKNLRNVFEYHSILHDYRRAISH